ncbi:glycosyltransferase family 9 protein [Kluyvera sp. CHPC 1.2972]|uniref:glycosyltransferase family 9 protein n=1 Tax=Kluyvera sp. CHPC 1.2972 TaxID=2995176 RepID=UPI002FD7B960
MRLNNIIYKLKALFASVKLPRPVAERSNLENKKVCLLLVNIGLGDAIMATSFLRALKNADIDVDVITAKKIVPLFQNNSDIHNVIIYGETAKYRDQIYDWVIDPYSHCGWYFTHKYIKLLAQIKYKALSGFDVKIPGKYNDNYIPSTKKIHITDYYLHFLRSCLDKQDVLPENYVLSFAPETRETANAYLTSLPAKTIKIAFCPYASTDKRSFCSEQINETLALLADHADISIILLMEKSKLASITLPENAYFFEAPDFMCAAAVLSMSDFVVSVDTSFVHVANSYNKPSLVFYSSVYNDGYNTDDLCGPNYLNAKQIIAKTGISALAPHYIYEKLKVNLSGILRP